MRGWRPLYLAKKKLLVCIDDMSAAIRLLVLVATSVPCVQNCEQASKPQCVRVRMRCTSYSQQPASLDWLKKRRSISGENPSDKFLVTCSTCRPRYAQHNELARSAADSREGLLLSDAILGPHQNKAGAHARHLSILPLNT